MQLLRLVRKGVERRIKRPVQAREEDTEKDQDAVLENCKEKGGRGDSPQPPFRFGERRI